MVVIKLVMWPGGDSEKEYPLSIGTLDKVGPGSYRIRLLKDAAFGGPTEATREKVSDSRNVWKSGFVSGHFPGARGAWDLLGGALNAVLGERIVSYRRGEK